MTTDEAIPLSAEPLVGLKRESKCFRLSPNRSFSRTPRGFEAYRRLCNVLGRHLLSAEPLVGLKQAVIVAADVDRPLSAEPLVGLKPHADSYLSSHFSPFSRTPRGFEAAVAPSLRRWFDDFQPNPSWV